MENNPYKDYSSADLLVLLSFSAESPEEAKNAFFELMLRHQKDLIRYCVAMCNTEANPAKFQVVIDPNDAVDIVWNAFYRIRERPDGFVMKESNTDDVEKAVGAYLKGIVKSEFRKKYFGIPDKKVAYEYEVDTSKDGVMMSTRKVLQDVSDEVKEALTALPMKEREVFLATAEFCTNHEYMPREICDLLREKLELPGDSSLQVYRHRARKKLQKRFEALNGK